MVHPSPLSVEFKDFVASHLTLDTLKLRQNLQRLSLHRLTLPRQCIHHSTIQKRLTVKTPGLSFNYFGNGFNLSAEGIVQTLYRFFQILAPITLICS